MKKLTLLTAALALVLGLSQCRKPNMPAVNGGSGSTQHVVLNATIDNGGSKIAEDGTGGIKWSVGDEIAVKQDATSLGTLECTNVSGTFEGDIDETSGNIQFTFGTQKFLNQTGALNDAISLSSGDVAYNAEGNYNVTMTMPHAVLKLDLSALGTESGNVVTIKGGSTTIASVTGVTNAANNPYYVAMPAAASKKYTISGNSIDVDKTWTLAANTFYTKTGSSTGEAIVIAGSTPVPDYLIPYDFSVSATTKVKFTRGNLQYLGTGTSGSKTPKWRIAENQSDYLGGYDYNDGPVEITGYDEDDYNNGSCETGPNETDHDKQVARDLFGWGCTGYQDTRKSGYDNWYQVNYQPYSTGNKKSISSCNYYGYGPDYNSYMYNLTVENKSDWGCNTIYYGSEVATGLRILSKDEWNYLLNSRTGASSMWGLGNIDYYGYIVCGLIILPDDWSLPDGMTFTGGATSYSTNSYVVDPDPGEGLDWAVMENAGAVFLPAASSVMGTAGMAFISGSYCHGHYWSSSVSDDYNAYYLEFINDRSVNPQKTGYRARRGSVRLVR